MRISTLACLLLISAGSFAQPAEKIWFDKKDSVYGYYVTIPPSTPRIQAALVLLDGYSSNADGFFPDTKIQNVAYANEILTVCIPTGPRLYPDKPMLELMNRILSEVANKYQLRKDQFAIGGMSSGGTIAVRYAELCHEKPEQYPILPKAVFDIDSPLDLMALFKSSQRELKRDFKGWWLGESQMIVDRFNNELGPVDGDLKKYSEASPFLGETPGAGNEQWLKETAIRSYHDVDVNWFIQNRRRSLYETNLLQASAFINQLVLEGNDKAEFVSSKIQGRRPNGQRHPHSWNIVDEIDLIQWIKETGHFYPDHLEKPYSYTAPANWQHELFLFPFYFAPEFHYNGFEDLRLSPGWNKEGNEKWAYTFLWWLDGNYSINEKTLAQDLETYYTGIGQTMAKENKLDLSLVTPAKAQVQKTGKAKGDINTYTATVQFFDAQVAKKQAPLYIKIHVKDMPDKTRTIVLFEVAGSPFTAGIWQQLDKVNEDLK
jgi:hypothetical protein